MLIRLTRRGAALSTVFGGIHKLNKKKKRKKLRLTKIRRRKKKRGFRAFRNPNQLKKKNRLKLFFCKSYKLRKLLRTVRTRLKKNKIRFKIKLLRVVKGQLNHTTYKMYLLYYLAFLKKKHSKFREFFRVFKVTNKKVTRLFFRNNSTLLYKKKKKYLKKSYKLKYLNFFYLFKKKKTDFFFLKKKEYFLKKHKSFWINERSLSLFYLNNYKKIKVKKLTKLRKLFAVTRLRQKKMIKTSTQIFLKKALVYYKKKKKLKKVKLKKVKTHFYNKLIMKKFWKAQDFIKTTFFKKQRWTTRKYKTKFNQWFKKNRISTRPTFFLKLFDLLVYLNVVNNKREFIFLIKSKLLLHNYKAIFFDFKNQDYESCVKKNDTISLPTNWDRTGKARAKKKLESLKKHKKLQYIRYKNIKSQWKSLRRSIQPQVFDILNFNTVLPSFLQYDLANNTYLIVKRPQLKNKLLFSRKRHNLERLTTWRLRI